MNLAYYPVQFYTPKTLKTVLHDSHVITLPADVAAATQAALTSPSVTVPTATPDYLINLYVGALAAIPFGIAAIASLFIAGHSDRQGSRKPHIIICSVVMALGLIVTSQASHMGTGGIATVVAIGGISMTAVGWFGAFATFWSLPAQLMTGTAVAAALAIVNSLGNLMGNFVGPNSRKWLGDQNSFYFAASWAAVAIIATLLLKIPVKKGESSKIEASTAEEPIAR
jgi:MFS family permease